MSDQLKRVLIIAAVIAAVCIAIFSVTRTVQATQPQNAGVLGGGKAPDPSTPGMKSKAGGE